MTGLAAGETSRRPRHSAGALWRDRTLAVTYPGRVGYPAALEMQATLVEQRRQGRIPDTLLLLEHPHTFTLGRRGRMEDILIDRAELDRLGVEVHHTDRGGEVTYHGPGQLVGYPIIDLRRWRGGPLKYVQALERMLADTLDAFGISATSEGHPTGVWVDDKKIAAIGVKVGRRVTTHGFALNVSPDLRFFKYIVPCGMPQSSVTSIERESLGDVRFDEVMAVLVRQFGRVLEFAPECSQVSYNPEEIVSATD